jgi:DNA topoisomerase-1
LDYPLPNTIERPFKLVIVESPSKCQTISKILNAFVQENNLDHDFVVTSSMGHIRNLPQSRSSRHETVAGIDLDHDYAPTYEIIPGKEQLVGELTRLGASARQLILATDDDREGEAMAWHLLQVLHHQKDTTTTESSTPQDPPLRVRFTEITPKAITHAITHAETSLRDNLVRAQETRRVLDRLAGFTVSPVLWKKIAPGLSAGRVQSVGMALVVRRERERLRFRETEYWSVKGNFTSTMPVSNDDQGGRLLDASLVSINGQTLASGTADFDPNQPNQLAPSSNTKLHLQSQQAAELIRRIEQEGDKWTWTVRNVTSSQRKQNPPMPFITSSLQQEANRRIGLSVSDTMRSAQQLYEKGFISYMRTDSMHLSDDARSAIELEIANDYGGAENFVAASIADRGKKPLSKKGSKKPDPQAAHEAVRPAVQADGRFLKPSELPPSFDGAARDIYRLIYQRTVSSHMPPQVSNQTSVTVVGLSDTGDDEVMFRISGSVVVDPGYTLVYPRQSDSKSPILPNLQEGTELDCESVQAFSHLTQPPARYTEASFVQELEALGVGRPSTYAGTVQILRDRSYVGSPVTSDSGRRGNVREVSGPAISAQRAAGGEEFTGSRNARGPMVPSLTAFVVTSLLEKHCNMYVDPSFTAKMEERLDKIASSEVNLSQEERVAYLDEFYRGEEGLAKRIKHIDESVDADEARRADLPSLEWNSSDTTNQRIGLFVGPWGPFVKKMSTDEDTSNEKPVTASLPPGMAADLSTITLKSLNAVLKSKEGEGSVLGLHPDDGRPIYLKTGPYGAYLQWGEDEQEGTTTHTLPRELRSFKTLDTDSAGESESLTDLLGLTLDMAVQYVNLPREVSEMNGLPIIASIGPYGPYLKYNNTYMSLSPKDGDVLTIDSETSQELVKENIVNGKKRAGAGVLAEIGEKEGATVIVKSGRFGPYITWNKINVNLPSEYRDDPSSISLEEVWPLIQEKASKTGKKKKQGKTSDSDFPPGLKRPPTAYLLFCSEKRNEVATKFSSLGEVSKELSRLWKATTEDERQPFVDKSEELKASYVAEKEQWKADTQTAVNGHSHKNSLNAKRTGVKGAGANQPKRPRSAYIFFCNANRASVSRKFSTLGEVSKELARRWADLDDSSRREFEEAAAVDKERYQNEMKQSLQSSESRQLISKEIAGGKKNRKKSAYMLFCTSHRSKIVDDEGNKLSLPETTKILAEMWRNCDEKTRSKFVNQAESEQEVVAS